ncbi:FAD/NAD(P)-binding domain-containing protein [Hortaea werneckii]|nr:FAD/NAD(P)-binding domain-containing protein [Hortaea werneckii]
MRSPPDWEIVQDNDDIQTAHLNTRYNLQTHDGAIIYIQTTGTRTGKRSVLEKLGEDQSITPDQFRMRLNLTLETGDPRYSWVNDGVFIASSGRSGTQVIYDAYQILLKRRLHLLQAPPELDVFPPHPPLFCRVHTRSRVNGAILISGSPTSTLAFLADLRRPPLIPTSIDQQVIQSERQESKLVPLEILRVVCAKVDSRSDTAHTRDFVGVDHGPAGGPTGVSFALQQPHPRDHEGIVCPAVAKLVPPILPDDLALVNFIQGPQVGVALLVQEDGLEDMVLEGDLWWELRLVVGAVEAHFELGEVFGIHANEVHGLEVVLAVFRVEVFIVSLHVLSILVRDSNVTGDGLGEEALGGICQDTQDDLVAESGLWPSFTGVRDMIFTWTPFLSLRVTRVTSVERRTFTPCLIKFLRQVS